MQTSFGVYDTVRTAYQFILICFHCYFFHIVLSLVAGLTNTYISSLTSHSDGASCPAEDDFLSRLLETGASESSNSVSSSQKEDDVGAMQFMAKKVLQNIIASFNDVCHVNEELAAAVLVALSEDGKTSKFMLQLIISTVFTSSLCLKFV